MKNISELDKLQILMRMDAKYLPDEYVDCIFHYTSPLGFQSILFQDPNNVTLWASRYDCLNDVSEGTIAEEILKEVCDELLENKKIDDYLHDLFSTVTLPRTALLHYNKGESIKITRPEFDRYVCSFSKNKDSLSMWNYYSKGNRYEGFNIGFYATNLKESLENFLGSVEAVPHVFPVIYKKSEQKQLIEKMLLKLKDLYKKEQEPQIRYIISNRLLDWSLIFKKECFEHEEEVRIIVFIAKHETKIPVNYRINSGYLVPYIELKIDKDSVSDIVFGPLQMDKKQKSHQVKIMEELISSKSYSAIVDYSEIPVRY